MEFLSDTDSESEIKNSTPVDVVFKPKELNNLLLEQITNIANTFPVISVLGDIINFKIWKRSGCSFDISLDDNKINCKAWEKDGLYPEGVKKYNNTQCVITGYLEATYYYGHKFVINVQSIDKLNNDTKLKDLKLVCQNKGYFDNKKEVDWNKINKIGVISKVNTQGYDDFKNQFKVPIEITLEQITLEGPKTYKECIQSIKKLCDQDVIIIMRGGGDTSEISNSFDCIELFESIKKSDVPIITAIGHEQDKGDKLLITNVSDIDYPTPTSCAKDLNKRLYLPLINILDIQLDYNQNVFNQLLQDENNKLYEGLSCFIEEFLKSKFGGRIVEIEDETSIIVKKDGKYYKNKLDFSDELKFTNQDVTLREGMIEALQERNISLIYQYYLKLNKKQHNLSSNIEDNIVKIKKNKKLEEKFIQSCAKKHAQYYLKTFNKSKNMSTLIKINEILLWYKQHLEMSSNGEDILCVENIYYFVKESF